MGERDPDIVIIGGGPAGLGISYLLTAAQRPHVVLEQGRIGESWRNRRWDSLRLVGPNWSLQFPGWTYAGHDPDGFMHRDEVVTCIEAYARTFDPPVREGVQATCVALGPGGRGFQVDTTDGAYPATHVVIATGANRVPNIPAVSARLPADILQVSAMAYRRPAGMPAGAVLVVGSGESGCQIAEELALAGRQVYLSAGRCRWVPARYRGQHPWWWVVQQGGLHGSATKGAGLGPQLTGQDGGRTLNLHTLARSGVTLLGRLEAICGTVVRFRPDLEATMTQADTDARQYIAAVDAYATAHGVGGPMEANIDDPVFWTHPAMEPILELDLAAARIMTVVWASGYRLDFAWVRLPAFDVDGYPEHETGVARYDGLYFPSLPGKDNFIGIAHDATHIAETLLARTSRRGV
jgi:putative flavoprotein involved in K+ transport